MTGHPLTDATPADRTDGGIEHAADGGTEAWYAYCLLRRADAARLSPAAGSTPIPGTDDRPLCFVGADHLVAATARVRVVDFQEAEREPDLGEHGWLATAVRRHERVVEHLFGQVAVLPLRFGALYPTEGGLVTALGRCEPELLAELSRLDGTVEWGVRAYLDTAALTRPGRSARLTEPGSAEAVPDGATEPVRPGAGTEWMLRRRESSRNHRVARELARRMADESHARLSRHARETVLCQRPARSTGGGTLVLDAAYLLTRDQDTVLRAEADDLSARHAASRLRFELTGPWPPYHFTRLTRGVGHG